MTAREWLGVVLIPLRVTTPIKRRVRLWWHSDILRHDGVYAHRASDPGTRVPLVWQCSCGAQETWSWDVAQ